MSPAPFNQETAITGSTRIFAARHPHICAVLLNAAAGLAVATLGVIVFFAGIFFHFEPEKDGKEQETNGNDNGTFVLLSPQKLAGSALENYLNHRNDLDFYYSGASGNAKRLYRLPSFEVQLPEPRKFITSNGVWTHSSLNAARSIVPQENRNFFLAPLPEVPPAEPEILVNGTRINWPAALPLPLRSAILHVSARDKLPLRRLNVVKSSGNLKYDRQLLELLERHLDELPPEDCTVVCRPLAQQQRPGEQK